MITSTAPSSIVKEQGKLHPLMPLLLAVLAFGVLLGPGLVPLGLGDANDNPCDKTEEEAPPCQMGSWLEDPDCYWDYEVDPSPNLGVEIIYVSNFICPVEEGEASAEGYCMCLEGTDSVDMVDHSDEGEFEWAGEGDVSAGGSSTSFVSPLEPGDYEINVFYSPIAPYSTVQIDTATYTVAAIEISGGSLDQQIVCENQIVTASVELFEEMEGCNGIEIEICMDGYSQGSGESASMNTFEVGTHTVTADLYIRGEFVQEYEIGTFEVQKIKVEVGDDYPCLGEKAICIASVTPIECDLRVDEFHWDYEGDTIEESDDHLATSKPLEPGEHKIKLEVITQEEAYATTTFTLYANAVESVSKNARVVGLGSGHEIKLKAKPKYDGPLDCLKWYEKEVYYEVINPALGFTTGEDEEWSGPIAEGNPYTYSEKLYIWKYSCQNHDDSASLEDYLPSYEPAKVMTAVILPKSSTIYKPEMNQPGGAQYPTGVTLYLHPMGEGLTGTWYIKKEGSEIPIGSGPSIDIQAEDHEPGTYTIECRHIGELPTFTSAQLTIIGPDTEPPPTLKLSWEKFASSYPPLEDNVDPFDGKVQGKRIFPGKKTPNDTRRNKVKLVADAGQPHTLIYVKVFDVDDPTPVSFDKDNGGHAIIDPDDDTTEGIGNDNRDDHLNTPKTGFFTRSGADTTSAYTDSRGIAEFEFNVGMQPGNNYRAVGAALDETLYASVQVDDPDSEDSAATYLGPDEDKETPTDIPSSPLLTVWRKLHLEIDSMEAPAEKIERDAPDHLRVEGESWAQDPETGKWTLTLKGNFEGWFTSDIPTNFYENGYIIQGATRFRIKSSTDYATVPDQIVIEGQPSEAQKALFVNQFFDVVDDDDLYLEEIGLQDPPLPMHGRSGEIVANIERAFYSAYIQAVDENGLNSRKTIPFYSNAYAQNFGFSVFDDNLDLAPYDSDDFWAFAVAFGYQPEEAYDADSWFDVATTYGGTPTTLIFNVPWGVSVVFMESNRERVIGYPSIHYNEAAIGSYVREYNGWWYGVIVHELGHAPGRQSGDADHAEEGLMADGAKRIYDDVFKAKTIKRFRDAKSWKQ